jgi:DNA-binding MarR family transcriptional regulator
MHTPAIDAFSAAMQIMRDELHPRVEAQTIMGFLFVASRGTTTVGDVRRAVNLTDGGASRLITLLTDEFLNPTEYRNKGRRGYGLVTRKPNPMDRRLKNVTLTSKGVCLAERITECMEHYLRKQLSIREPLSESASQAIP